ncbi:hypothetical protein JCM6882_008810 [Rhodosporidiobolus microsporus]
MAPPATDGGYELAGGSPERTRSDKGKERALDGEQDTDDLEGNDEDSDAEIEELLRIDAALPLETTTEEEDAPLAGGGRARSGSGASRASGAGVGGGGTRGTGSRGGGKLLDRLLGGSSASQRRKFAREMLRETLPVLLFSLFGAVLTGELLEKLQTWRVFIRIEELFILVPILLNLKGNLEMNLAARFSTSANIGELDLRATRRSLVLGNLALLQVQALIVSLISGLLAFILGLASRKGVHHGLQHPLHNAGTDETAALRGGYFEALLVLCVSMLAASLSSGVLGSFMCSIVILCRRFRINPDNISTPLASALGDMVTLVILGLLSSLFIIFMGTIISTLVFLALLGAVAFNVVITFRNAYVQELLTIGWGPLFVAMAISSGSGMVLKTYITSYPGFGLVSTALNALTGGAGSIFVSRISTALHSGRREHYVVSALSLAGLTGCVLAAFGAFAWGTGQSPGGVVWAGGWAGVVVLQTCIALFLAYQGTLLLWRWDYDPDVYALPLLTSFLDVSGQLLLVGCYALTKKLTGADWSDEAADAAQAGASATATAASAAASATATALGLR